MLYTLLKKATENVHMELNNMRISLNLPRAINMLNRQYTLSKNEKNLIFIRYHSIQRVKL